MKLKERRDKAMLRSILTKVSGVYALNIIINHQEPYLEEFRPPTIVNAYYSPLTHRISTIVYVIARLSGPNYFQ